MRSNELVLPIDAAMASGYKGVRYSLIQRIWSFKGLSPLLVYDVEIRKVLWRKQFIENCRNCSKTYTLFSSLKSSNSMSNNINRKEDDILAILEIFSLLIETKWTRRFQSSRGYQGVLRQAQCWNIIL